MRNLWTFNTLSCALKKWLNRALYSLKKEPCILSNEKYILRMHKWEINSTHAPALWRTYLSDQLNFQHILFRSAYRAQKSPIFPQKSPKFSQRALYIGLKRALHSPNKTHSAIKRVLYCTHAPTSRTNWSHHQHDQLTVTFPLYKGAQNSLTR